MKHWDSSRTSSVLSSSFFDCHSESISTWGGFIYVCVSCGTAGTTHTQRLIFSPDAAQNFLHFFGRNLFISRHHSMLLPKQPSHENLSVYLSSIIHREFSFFPIQLQLSLYPNGIYFHPFNSTFLRQSAGWKLVTNTEYHNITEVVIQANWSVGKCFLWHLPGVSPPGWGLCWYFWLQICQKSENDHTVKGEAWLHVKEWDRWCDFGDVHQSASQFPLRNISAHDLQT